MINMYQFDPDKIYFIKKEGDSVCYQPATIEQKEYITFLNQEAEKAVQSGYSEEMCFQLTGLLLTTQIGEFVIEG